MADQVFPLSAELSSFKIPVQGVPVQSYFQLICSLLRTVQVSPPAGHWIVTRGLVIEMRPDTTEMIWVFLSNSRILANAPDVSAADGMSHW